jgi:hypothetical protein
MESSIDLSKLDILVKSLNESLDSVGTKLALATAAVVVGLLIEYEGDVRKVFWALVDGVRNRNLTAFWLIESHVRRAVLGGVFTIGVGAELWYEYRTSAIGSQLQSANGQIVAFLNGKAQDSERATQTLRTEAESAHKEAEGFKAQIADDNARVKVAEAQVATAKADLADAVARVKTADARIAEANRAADEARQMAVAEQLERVKLAAVVAPRSLSLEQQASMSTELKVFSGRAVELVSYGMDPEGAGIATQIITSLSAAGLKVSDSRFSIVRLGGFSNGVHVNGPAESQDLVLALGSALNKAFGSTGSSSMRHKWSVALRYREGQSLPGER